MSEPVSEFIDLAAELSEPLLDSVLNDGVLKEVPVFGGIIGLARASMAVRDRLLLRKIGVFMKAFDRVSPEERAKFADEIAADSTYRERVETAIVHYLDRAESTMKAEVLGIAFKALLRHELTQDEFRRIAFCIDRCFADDLMKLDQYEIAGDKGLITSLSAINIDGLINLVPTHTDDENLQLFRITGLGAKLTQILRAHAQAK